jgi:glutamyl-tRNA synthetase
MTTVRTRIAIAYRRPPRRHRYIALFNYCFAKQHGGEFILRIEDTDQLRSPRVGTADLRRPALARHRMERRPGRRRPARPVPAERAWRDLRQVRQQLVDMGHAFYCFCTAEELDQMRAEQMARGETPLRRPRAAAERGRSRSAAWPLASRT